MKWWAWVLLALLVIGLVGSIGEDGADDSSQSVSADPPDTTTVATIEPVKVTKRDLDYMATTIMQEYRAEADLTGSTDDYAVSCQLASEGKAKCTIEPFLNGRRPLVPYTRVVSFDSADPRSFEVP